MDSIFAKKITQTQNFLEDGTRVPVTVLLVPKNAIVQVKTKEKDGYNAIQLAIDEKKRANKSLLGKIKKAGIDFIPRFLREVRVEDTLDIGEKKEIKASDVLKPGDLVDVSGISKGKGFAGVVKRHHFAGGPRTHGQSDRERAPGSIGQTTTPGRVYKGKRMAGRMGAEKTTIKNLEVLSVEDDKILIKGLVPGTRGSLVFVKKVGENKKFIPLLTIKNAQETDPNSQEKNEENKEEAG